MTWFKDLTGVEEGTPAQVRARFSVDGEDLVCPDGRRITAGRLETPSLAELRARVAALPAGATARARTTLREVVADARLLHADPAHANAVFQVASQFNLLEMMSPSVTPDNGITDYIHDRTQGPVCAMACGAGTIYRNYFAPVASPSGDRVGQTAEHQIDCAADLGRRLGNEGNRLWAMQNGYLLPSAAALGEIADTITAADEDERDRLRASLRIGLQHRVAVTVPGAGHRITQAYCSALPVAYSNHSAEQWEPFARLILEATYEATFAAAALNHADTGSRQLFLTLVGGGAFGNETQWIIDAIEHAARRHAEAGLDVGVVSYGTSSPDVQALLHRLA